MNVVDVAPINVVDVAPMNVVDVAPMNVVDVAPINVVEVAPMNVVDVAPMNVVEVAPMNVVDVAPMNVVDVGRCQRGVVFSASSRRCLASASCSGLACPAARVSQPFTSSRRAASAPARSPRFSRMSARSLR